MNMLVKFLLFVSSRPRYQAEFYYIERSLLNLTLLHKYLSSPLPSFNVVLETTGFVWASIMAKTTLLRGWGGGQFVRLAVSSYGVDIGKQANLSQEFCQRL